MSCELYEWTFIQKDCRHFVILLHSNQTETVISYRDNLTATAWTHTQQYVVHTYNRKVISKAWRGGIFHVLTLHCPVNENRSKVKKSGKHPFFRRLQHKSQQKCTQICIFLYFLKLRLLKVIRLSKTSF